VPAENAEAECAGRHPCLSMPKALEICSAILRQPKRVAPFHLDHRVDQLSRRALRSRAPAWPGAVEQTIFSLDQGSVKTREGGGLQDHSHPAQASGRHQERAEAENGPIPSGQVGTPTPRTLHDQQLVFDGQRFSRHRTNPPERASRASVTSRCANRTNSKLTGEKL
jgi:hypothetical protein